jgi:hypothetical protein
MGITTHLACNHRSFFALAATVDEKNKCQRRAKKRSNRHVRRAQEKFCGLVTQLFPKDDLIGFAEHEVSRFFKRYRR